jgi:hypothetical protein
MLSDRRLFWSCSRGTIFFLAGLQSRCRPRFLVLCVNPGAGLRAAAVLGFGI